MTMVPSQSFFNQQQEYYNGYGGCGDGYTGSLCHMNKLLAGYDYCIDSSSLGSDLVVVGPMAEEESRTSSVNEAGSSSKDPQEQERDERWLQLGVGGGADYVTNANQQVEVARKSGLLELDLLPGGSNTSSQQHHHSHHNLKPLVPTFNLTDFRPPRAATDMLSITSLLPHPRATSSSSSFSFPQQHEVTWGYRPPPHPWNPSSSSSPLMALGPYYQRPFQQQTTAGMAGPSSTSTTVRIIDAPRRIYSNIWFSLQASQHQVKEPFLPQIPKSYLRIKDGRMTVRVLKKYLVSKLRLDSESEIEIRCRGQELPEYLTLQHVRDTIWSNSSSISSRRDGVTLHPDSSTTDHVMILQYGRSA